MRRPTSRARLRQAFALGLAQGPTELLPVSSSAHTALLPGLLGWREAELDGERTEIDSERAELGGERVEVDREARNSLEVALHAGTAGALLVLLLTPAARRGCVGELGQLDARRLAALTLALAPPALAGRALERRLERRPTMPPTIAVGLVAGAAAMAVADARPGGRTLADVGPADGLALGVAQALALLPGVSRNGATLTAARLRGFTREDSQALSWRVGLPVLLGAAALKGARLRGGVSPRARGHRAAHAAGAAGAFLSTLAAAPLIHPSRRGRPLAPFSLYRCALALVALRRRRGRPAGD